MRLFIFKEVSQVGQKANKLKLVYVIVICIYLQAIYKITFHIINFTYQLFALFLKCTFNLTSCFSHIIIALPHVEYEF
jgi:hypothetical protein